MDDRIGKYASLLLLRIEGVNRVDQQIRFAEARKQIVLFELICADLRASACPIRALSSKAAIMMQNSDWGSPERESTPRSSASVRP